MWKKEDAQNRDTVEPETAARRERPAPPRSPGDRATIGRSITIRGEVTGDEDLVIQGRIEGSVDLKQHSVTVGPEGEVTANIRGRLVTIEGHVEGDLNADEWVVLRDSARVEGDISAPRVTVEDGAYFRGGIDMGDTGRAGPGGEKKSSERPRGEKTRSEPVKAESGGESKTAAEGTSTDRGTESTQRTG